MSALVARQYKPIGDARGSTEVAAAIRRYRSYFQSSDYTAATGAVTLSAESKVIFVTGGTYTITLPSAAGAKYEYQFIYVSGSGTVTISDGGSFSETIDAIGEVVTVYDDPGTGAYVLVEDNRTVWGGDDVTINGNLTLDNATATLTVGPASPGASEEGLITLKGGTSGVPALQYVDSGNAASFDEGNQQYVWSIGGTGQLIVATAHTAPSIDSAMSLGLTGNRWSDFFTDAATIGTSGIQVGDTTIGMFGATPVAQQATTGTTTGFTAGSGTAANDDSTYTGNSGTAAYTVGDIVLALKNIGILAAS